jgi:hypothetical protein
MFDRLVADFHPHLIKIPRLWMIDNIARLIPKPLLLRVGGACLLCVSAASRSRRRRFALATPAPCAYGKTSVPLCIKQSTNQN